MCHQWGELTPPLQLDIYENTCLRLGSAEAQTRLGLTNKEFKELAKHTELRRKQTVYEAEVLRLVQEDQRNAILRIDHSAKLRNPRIGQDYHELCTIRYFHDYHPDLDYGSVNARELDLARSFMRQRHLDLDVLRNWECDGNYTLHGLGTKSCLSAPDSGYISEVSTETTRPAALFEASLSMTKTQDSRRRRQARQPSKIHPTKSQGSHASQIHWPTSEELLDPSQISSPSSQLVHMRNLSDARSTASDMQLRKRSVLKQKRTRKSRENEESESLLRQRGGALYGASADGLAEEDLRSPRLTLRPPMPPHSPKPLSIKLKLKTGSDGTARVRKEKPRADDAVEKTQEDPTTPSNAAENIISYRPAIPVRTPTKPKAPLPVARVVYGIDHVLPSHFPQHRKLNDLTRKLVGLSSSDLDGFTPQSSAVSKPHIAHKRTPQSLSNDTEMTNTNSKISSERKDSAASLHTPLWTPITERAVSSPATSSRLHSSHGIRQDHAQVREPYNEGKAGVETASASPQSFVTAPSSTPERHVPRANHPSITEPGSPVFPKSSPAQSPLVESDGTSTPSDSNTPTNRATLTPSFQKQERNLPTRLTPQAPTSSTTAHSANKNGGHDHDGDDETPTSSMVQSISVLKAATQALVNETESVPPASAASTPAKKTTSKKVKTVSDGGQEKPKEKRPRGKRGPYKKTREKMESERLRLEREASGTALAVADGPTHEHQDQPDPRVEGGN